MYSTQFDFGRQAAVVIQYGASDYHAPLKDFKAFLQ